MRQARKREILNFIDDLQQAHDEIREALKRHELASVQTMLAECQEFAVGLGKAIEETEGENCVTVSHVEEYCETLFRVFEGITTGYDTNKIYKILRKELLRVENSVKNDIPVRREVVFFPYKAAMWDSLESVYLAAKEDPDCDAYCVPIPYFERNEDNSLGIMHYEGSEYPANIEITDWQAYDLEERRPDVVFIHNPYDGLNYITSVHPRYYAENLKKYTDQLVYIPYFILSEISPDDPDREKKIEDMEVFCFLPGTIYADKVVVQSEDMRQIYINKYLKKAKDYGLQGKHLNRVYLEQKFWGLGSPKYDRVAAIIKEDLDIPQEWLRVIEKPDQSWKKIVLYNTGVTTLLTHNMKWVDKIENVLKTFRENQDEVALLWRPHPLVESTMKSMRPEVLEKYMILKKQYLAEGWGIYDETADVGRAVVLSDAYYGDNSSVVQLYEQTGKLIMIQNVETIYEKID